MAEHGDGGEDGEEEAEQVETHLLNCKYIGHLNFKYIGHLNLYILAI